MNSSDDRAGRELFKKWATLEAEIQVTFVGADSFGFRMEGHTFLGADRLEVRGSKCECFVPLPLGCVLSCASKDDLAKLGLPSETYGETVVVSLAPLGRFVFTALPEFLPEREAN